MSKSQQVRKKREGDLIPALLFLNKNKEYNPQLRRLKGKHVAA